MIRKANEEILERIKAKLMEVDKNIKEEYLFFIPTILTDCWLGVKKSEGCMIEYLPTERAHRTSESFVVCLYDNGLICICGDEESIKPGVLYYKNIEDFENDKSMLFKYRVEIVETYRRYIEVEAENEDAAYRDIDDKIAEGEIDLPCDGEDYKYGRELFVSEIKEDDGLSENDNEEEFCVWSSGNGSVNYDTGCGHTYFPYVKTFDQPRPIENGEYDMCPWCSKRIEYNDGNDW